ncbi:hypothetical protein BGZ63DRAFT_407506 [Mariannaea sp. PMI_226]|nr:hypothetical protein BGZ63DRAFT_407506 [Mariannaea sp. PMI_226]
MASSSRLGRVFLERIERASCSLGPSAMRNFSTTSLRRAAPVSKASSSSSTSSATESPLRSRSAIRVVRPNLSSRAPQPPSAVASSPPPPPPPQTSPAQDAIRTAEARESALRAARLRRAHQRQEEALEEKKRTEAKKEYTKRYNTAARKWVSGIIALPIFFVTSYYLFDRLALGNEQKTMPRPKVDE